MGLFRRNRSDALVHPVSAFWHWWADQGRLIDPHQPSVLLEQLSERVAAIHPGLTWHFGPGRTSEHRLTVSAGGIAEVRPTAERWLRAAPPTDARWEFRASQEAEPSALKTALDIDGHRFDLSKTLFRVEPSQQKLRISLGVHHPMFPEVPERTRLQVTYLVLDWLLGEDDVERWLGHIEPLGTVPVSPVDGAGVLHAVALIAERRDPEEWSLAQWQDADGNPGLAIFRQGLRWIDYPALDMHHTVRASYEAQDNGLPADGTALEPLRRLEEELTALLGSGGILVGHQSITGYRVFHIYTDGEDQNTIDKLASWALAHSLRIESAHDPAWRRTRHFTG